MSDTPRIYVASLSDYNAGTLRGVWIEIDEGTDADDIQTAVDAMLAGSTEGIAEEWAIHDYEGFEPIKLSESESFETVAKLAELIAEHDGAFAAWYDSCDGSYFDLDEVGDKFEEQYQGEYDNAEAWAWDYASDCGILAQVEAIDNAYVVFDAESFARDAGFEGMVFAKTPDYRVWVFNPNA